MQPAVWRAEVVVEQPDAINRKRGRLRWWGERLIVWSVIVSLVLVCLLTAMFSMMRGAPDGYDPPFFLIGWAFSLVFWFTLVSPIFWGGVACLVIAWVRRRRGQAAGTGGR